MPMSPRLLRPRAAGNFATDTDARAYIEAVRIADGSYMEPAVQVAINDFIAGCKTDIWTAIKSSCILMGARTLAGALTPLVGSAPSNNGPFVSGDYNRKTGLKGDGVGKYLDTNRNNNADPQNSSHNAVYVTSAASVSAAYIGAGAAGTGSTQFAYDTASGGTITWRNRSSTGTGQTGISLPTGFLGSSRATSGSYSTRANGTTATRTVASQTPFSGLVLVFARNDASNVAGQFSDARMAFFSIGESLDLALLDSRITTLYNAIGAAL